MHIVYGLVLDDNERVLDGATFKDDHRYATVRGDWEELYDPAEIVEG